MMVFQVMREVRNTFYTGYCENGSFDIKNGFVTLRGEYNDGCYVLLSGSQYDEVYKLNKYDSNNSFKLDKEVSDSFIGVVYRLDVPSDFITLCEEIAEYVKKMPTSTYTSERFGEYSYTRSENTGSWEKAFSLRLKKYRKMLDVLLEHINEGAV